MKTLCILGRQPAIGLAELESRLGATSVQFFGKSSALLTQQESDFTSYGSILKSGQIIFTDEYPGWKIVEKTLQNYVTKNLSNFPAGKITIGISTYGLNIDSKQITATALELKKVFKKSGASARVVPNKTSALNTAQTLHNKLTSPNGLEFLIVKNANKIVIAKANWVQDIDAYRKRDQERPYRDAKIGMLPPKLAQTIINLAQGQNQVKSLLDPFCGTGVLIQEAALSGIQTVGTDLEPRMVEYSQKNLDWLKDSFSTSFKAEIYQADATTALWKHSFETLAAETYLGRPLSSLPDSEALQKIIHDCNTIHKKFLKNLEKQTQTGFRLSIAVPAWHIKGRVHHLPILDHLKELGYNRISFSHAQNRDLVYQREGQIVGRELVVLTRK